MGAILACVDLSDVTDEVTDTAAALAAAFGGPLHLLHVAVGEPALAGYDTDPLAAHTRDERAGELHGERTWLHNLAERVAKAHPDPALEVVPLVSMGPVLEVIEHEIDRIGATLVVLGSHGHGRLHHLLVGSTTEQVLRRVTVPVVVVPPVRT